MSTAQASRVLAQLAELGIVRREESPPSAMHELVHDNVVVRTLHDLRDIHTQVLSRAQELARSIEPAPIHLSIFGSVATGLANAQSDIDVLAVRPAGSDDDDRWVETLGAWNHALGDYAGNRVSVIELGERQWRDRRLDEPLWRSIERDQVVLIGDGVRVLS